MAKEEAVKTAKLVDSGAARSMFLEAAELCRVAHCRTRPTAPQMLPTPAQQMRRSLRRRRPRWSCSSSSRPARSRIRRKSLDAAPLLIQK
jgi:hypothetical protein